VEHTLPTHATIKEDSLANSFGSDKKSFDPPSRFQPLAKRPEQPAVCPIAHLQKMRPIL
jgi:hypothetical protein